VEARTEVTQIKAHCAHPDSEYHGFIKWERPNPPASLAFIRRTKMEELVEAISTLTIAITICGVAIVIAILSSR